MCGKLDGFAYLADDAEMADRFGILLKKHREQLEFTQWDLYQELAERCPRYTGLRSGSIVSRWESGNRKPPPHETILVLEELLAVSDNLLLKAAGYTLVTPEPITEQTEFKQRLGEKISDQERTVEEEKLVALVQEWRKEVASYSLVQLLRSWLDEAYSDAIRQFFTDIDTRRLYMAAREPHYSTCEAKRAFLQVENDPAFESFRQRFPTANAWTAFRTWEEKILPYLEAFHHMLGHVEGLAACALKEVAVDSIGMDDGSLSGFSKKFRMKRSLATILLCDFLACSLAVRPPNTHWAYLGMSLENLRYRVSLDLSLLTKISPEGGWASGVSGIRTLQPDYPLTVTEAFLKESIELQWAEESLTMALNELEDQI